MKPPLTFPTFEVDLIFERRERLSDHYHEFECCSFSVVSSLKFVDEALEGASKTLESMVDECHNNLIRIG